MHKEEFVAIYQLVAKTRQGAHGNHKVTLMEHQHVTADASNWLLGNQVILQAGCQQKAKSVLPSLSTLCLA